MEKEKMNFLSWFIFVKDQEHDFTACYSKCWSNPKLLLVKDMQIKLIYHEISINTCLQIQKYNSIEEQ